MATKPQAMFFLNTVIRPALQKIELWSQAAEELMLGTAMVESDLLHRKQIGGGPARGLFQMEIATHDDIWNNFLKYRSQLANAIASLQSSSNANKHVEIENNDQYACAMARASYLRAPAPLPQAGDILGMASYWKQYYNTVVGAGTVSKYVQKWHQSHGGQMKALLALLLLFWWNTFAYGNGPIFCVEEALSLTGQDIASIKPNSAITRKSFEEDWGQFEILIPKNRFPIPAPNCRKNIILRMPAVAPDAPDREKQMEFRWQIFRSLHDLIDNKVEHLEVFIASGPYMSVDKHGKPVLQYCNAYFSTKYKDQ
ncbi:MAG: hypothetical protein C5S49_00030 [Candidatus Methanogaster sp.]|nr:MAG: hypothetical protein C5S49_00030 [ANME-2 cluster archaeon]